MEVLLFSPTSTHQHSLQSAGGQENQMMLIWHDVLRSILSPWRSCVWNGAIPLAFCLGHNGNPMSMMQQRKEK
jgi:hypothetical protein